MKPVIHVLVIIAFANLTNAQAPENYADLWKDVANLESKGLPKSALKIVELISEKAKASNNAPQEIKSLLFKSKYALILEEDAQLKIITDFKNAISKSQAPTKNILQNILATLYWQYFNQNKWKFYNRTKTNNYDNESDFRTWDLETLFTEVATTYDQSLADGLILQQTDLTEYEAILKSQKDSKIYRPTLFDLLAHNALEFYKSEENTITKPSYAFEIDNPELLSTSRKFATLTLASKDSSSLQLKALKIYQDLISFHLEDPEALAEIDIERLHFITQYATFNNKKDILLTTLKAESRKWSANKKNVAALYEFEIANLYQQQGLQYQPKTNDTYRWKLKEAIDVCESAIKNFPDSKGAQKCLILKNQILSQSLEITSEAVLPRNTPALVLINYKNIEDINFKIGTISEANLLKLSSNGDPMEQLKILNKMEPIRSWTSTLKNEGDYQPHTTEIALPKLNTGRYIIFGQVLNSKNTYAYQEVQITDIAYIQKENGTGLGYQIINRVNGKPIAQANVSLHFTKNYQGPSITENYTTDDNGEFIVPSEQFARRQIKLHIKTKDDEAIFNNLSINRYYSRNNNSNTPSYRAFLFTDRSIYRPGQQLYFKGIVMTTTKDKSQVLSDLLVNVSLYNSNGVEVEKLELKTNAFGSVSGNFIVPNNGLTGSFFIQLTSNNSSNAYQDFSVEEYKRPKFKAEFKPISKTYKINDTIIANGNAMAYAGSTITDAKVVYRVNRNVQYPRWFSWSRTAYTVDPQEITFGETTTDANGNFEIKFKALADTSVDKTALPTFSYEVTADITDVNGETRSTSTTIKVGYHALMASIEVSPKLDKKDKTHKIGITTKNLNGAPVPAKGTLKIYKLIAPKTVLRSRPWQAPDYQTFSKSEFKMLFPHEAYANEDNSMNWDKGELVYTKNFNTGQSNELKLETIKKWESGRYVIILESKDRFGQTVKDEIQTSIYSGEDKKLADNILFEATTQKTHYKSGETVDFTLASSANDIVVTIEVEKDDSITSKQIINLSNNKKTIQIPVTSKDLGGFAVHYTYAFKNSFKHGVLNISVPYPKTDLEIETITFRDKLQPGTDETWQFKIKGPKGDKVAAELLAGMYDASLDQFKRHDWNFNPLQKPYYYSRYQLSAGRSFATNRFRVLNLSYTNGNYSIQNFDRLNFFELRFGFGNQVNLRGAPMSLQMKENSVMYDDGNMDLEETIVADSAKEIANQTLSGQVRGLDSAEGNASLNAEKTDGFETITIRKNLQETAFFFPQLQTDIEGNVSFSFTTPEALTQWKLQLLAHTKSLESAMTTLESITQKELMVIPNAPRFLREGDRINISSKIANLTDNELQGTAILQLFDALTGKSIDQKLSNNLNQLAFQVSAKGNTNVTWTLEIPFDVSAVQYKIIAKAGNYSDGEQNTLPVLSNRMLVTETLPMWIKSNETKTFTLNKLANTNSKSLNHHKLSLEITSNPAWYAVQALPYLMEYPYDCNEQTFGRYYANALATHIANSNPRIKEVFNQWRNTDALLSNLEKNQELKSILIQETPWLRDAQSETEQKKRIALLFDLNKMTNELTTAKDKLKNGQMDSGAWPWFNGGPSSRYITQHIITGFGHLNKLSVSFGPDETQMIEKAIQYLDEQFIKEYRDIRKYSAAIDVSKNHLSSIQLHYLYMRSFFPQLKKSEEVQTISDYYHTQIKSYWIDHSLYEKGLMTLIVHRMNDQKTTSNILKSLRETSITSEELGMYWLENTNSWHWYQAPIETQSLLIEVFSETGQTLQKSSKHRKDIDNLKIWLLKNKQTNRWETTKATTDAIYALLLQGSDWLSVTEMVDVSIGGKPIQPSKLEAVKIEAGTGYFKTTWNASEIKQDMANVILTKKGDGIAWGSLYWQYFEDLDKITTAKTPLKLSKKLFKKTNTDTGEEIIEITTDTNLNVGDLVRVRIELRSDRAMEFVHMKDMRAAGLEPVNVLSQYKYQDGLGYYESTKDASTNFFFDYLPKGIYVFEYDLRVNNAGYMSNGITSIQSMYAPEFSSHSEGIKILVD